MVTYRPKWQDGRAMLYGATGGLMIFVGLVEHYSRQSPPELIVYKVATIPIYILASNGIEFICNSDQAYKRWTAQYFERHALDAWAFATFFTVVINSDIHSTLNELITWFVIMLVSWFSLNLFFRFSDKRRAKSK
jgi:hypothetical protein